MDPLERFVFSQSSLQDYVDCAHRFQLRYIERVAWPAIQAEPARENERHIQRGDRFHRLAQQYLLGLPVEKLNRLAETDEDDHLLGWWRNFLDCIPEELIGQRHVEVGLEAPLGGYRVQAKYDLVLLRPEGSAIIYDWKTVLRRPTRERLLNRLQTRVYPYLLVRAGATLNHNCAIQPEQIQMIYWFADPAQPPEQIRYSAQQCQEDEAYLHGLVGQVRAAGTYPLAEQEQTCNYCVYRSLCGRGTTAATLDGSAESDDSPMFDFNLEQIAEISF